jgi:hypothetical protein
MAYITPRWRAVTKIQSHMRRHIAQKKYRTMLRRKLTAQAAAQAAGLAGYEFTSYRFPFVTLTHTGPLGLELEEREDGLTRLVRIDSSTLAECHPQLRPGLIILVVNRDSVVGATHAQVVQLLDKAARPLSLHFVFEEFVADFDVCAPTCDDSVEVTRENESSQVPATGHAHIARLVKLPRELSGRHEYTPLSGVPVTQSRCCSGFVGLALTTVVLWLLWRLLDLETLLAQETAELQAEVQEEMLLEEELLAVIGRSDTSLSGDESDGAR